MEELRAAQQTVAVGVAALEQLRVAAPLAKCDHAIAIVIQIGKPNLLIIVTRGEFITGEHPVPAGVQAVECRVVIVPFVAGDDTVIIVIMVLEAAPEPLA